MAGFFVAFEGPEGAGKSTQIRRLAATLEEHGHRTFVTREPGGTPAGDAIRAVLLDPRHEIDPLPEFLLYAASRAQHVREAILPALDAGKVVLSDRFAGASTAYQGYGRGLDLAFIGGGKFGHIAHEADRYEFEENRMMPSIGVKNLCRSSSWGPQMPTRAATAS